MSQNAVLPLFFESEGKQIFALLQEPQSGLNHREGVLMCSPAPHEMKKYHWAQRQMANRLQEAGYTVLRFDYFASGDSEGDTDEFDLDQCQKNIEDAISYLKDSGLVRRLTVVATRLGGPLAVRALANERIKRLVLIDPVLDGAAYLAQKKQMHRQLLSENPLRAPFNSSHASHRQLLGSPHSVRLDLQLNQLQLGAAPVKCKSLCWLQTRDAASQQSLDLSFGGSLDDVQTIEVSDDLRWNQLHALQRQDFPNELINAAVDAVRAKL